MVLLQCPQEKRWLRFTRPVETVRAVSIAEVLPALRRIEELVRARHLTAAGYIAYEASPAFDSSLVVRTDAPVPFLHFGLYETAEELDTLETPGRRAPCIDWSPR